MVWYTFDFQHGRSCFVCNDAVSLGNMVSKEKIKKEDNAGVKE